MENRSPQNYCTQCGAQMLPDSRYCAVCGTPAITTDVTPNPTREASSSPTAKPPPRRRVYGRILGIWLILAILVAISGFGYGWMQESGDVPHSTVLSPEQEQAIIGYGPPDAWIVADGPTSPGGDHARLEEWYHFDETLVITFVNGTATDARGFTPFEDPAPANSYDPSDFNSLLERVDVENMLGEEGTPIDDLVTPFPGYQAYHYAWARLLIGYLDDQFYSAQTY